MYDSNYQRLMHAGSLGHAWHKDILKRWRKPGDVTDVPRIERVIGIFQDPAIAS